jgi:ferredoxin
MISIVEKHFPMSIGDGKAARKKKPRILAITTDCCTGCAGSPACIEYCPIEACMFWVPDEDHPPFGRIEVDPNLCIGCQKCISKGPDGAFLDGCPWDAIEMVPTDDWEAAHGIQLSDAPVIEEPVTA